MRRGTRLDLQTFDAESGWERSMAESARRGVGVLILNTQQRLFAPQHVHATLARLLDRERFRVFVATPRDGEGRPVWEETGATVWAVPLGTSITLRRGLAARAMAALSGAQLLGGLLQLAVRIRREQIAIVHTETKPRDALGGLVLSLLTGAHLVIHWHVLHWGWYPLIWRLAFRRARLIVAVSEASRRSLISLGVPGEKIAVLYNGIDLGRYRPDLDGAPTRRELGIAPNATVVLLPGRLTPDKGQVELLRAVALLRDRGREVVALIVGADDPSATPGGGSHRAELERLRDELGIADLVVFAGHRSDLPAVMAAADVVAMPSVVAEALGLVALEAMACRRPVVATRRGGIPEAVEDGVTGLLVPAGDPAALAGALERLLADQALGARLVANGRRRVEERFTRERMAREAGRLYAALLGLGPSTDAARPAPVHESSGAP